MSRKVKPSQDKIVAQTMRKVLNPRTRKARVKSEADIWFEQMKADFVQNGAEHLASAKAKLAK